MIRILFRISLKCALFRFFLQRLIFRLPLERNFQVCSADSSPRATGEVAPGSGAALLTARALRKDLSLLSVC